MIRCWSISLMASLLAGVAMSAWAQAPAPPIATKRAEIRTTDRGLELHVDARLAARIGSVRIPRLNNPVAAIYFEEDKDRTPLKLTPYVADWEIGLPIELGRSGPLVVVVEMVGPPRWTGEPRIVGPSVSGRITLAAHDAVTHGETLRYEPQPHKNTVGYWSRQEDWCEWHFAMTKAGRYEVEILQGCGKGHGGSEVALVVGGQEIVFTVEETGHFQNFKNRTLGPIELTAGDDQTLALRPRTKAGGAVMDVRQVRLIPVNPAP